MTEDAELIARKLDAEIISEDDYMGSTRLKPRATSSEFSVQRSDLLQSPAPAPCARFASAQPDAPSGLEAIALTGMDWRRATSLGILMNTRGLMELIVLNIDLDLEVISPALFTMMVLMALVTTIATTPVLQLLGSSWFASASNGRVRAAVS